MSGLSPKQNREVPPLDYERVYKIKQNFPNTQISINGGITSYEQANTHLNHLDGVMIGREVYQNPFMLVEADKEIWGDSYTPLTRPDIIDIMAEYCDRYVSEGGRVWHVARHMLGLCNGLGGAKQYRRFLSENARREGAAGDFLKEAFALVTL